jgi:hypothetical protein
VNASAGAPGGRRRGHRPHAREQQQADHEVARCQREEGPAPTRRRVREQAARELSRHHPRQRSRQEARQRRLPVLVGDRVADPGHRQRDHARGRHAPDDAQDDERVEAVGQRAGEGARRASEERDAHEAGLAVAVTQRPEEQLHEPIGHGEADDHAPGDAGGEVEVVRQTRDQGVAHTQSGAAEEGGAGEEEDEGAAGGRCRFARCHRPMLHNRGVRAS